MTLTYISEILRIDDLTSVSVSDIEEDVDSGGFARRIEFYTDALNILNRRPVLTVLVYGDEESLKIHTPTLAFSWLIAILSVGALAANSWFLAMGDLLV